MSPFSGFLLRLHIAPLLPLVEICRACAFFLLVDSAYQLLLMFARRNVSRVPLSACPKRFCVPYEVMTPLSCSLIQGAFVGLTFVNDPPLLLPYSTSTCGSYVS